jgi:hypothetical protein
VPVPSSSWPFYVALGLFRAAAIAAGVHRRALQGNASAANAADLGASLGARAELPLCARQMQNSYPLANTAIPACSGIVGSGKRRPAYVR